MGDAAEVKNGSFQKPKDISVTFFPGDRAQFTASYRPTDLELWTMAMAHELGVELGNMQVNSNLRERPVILEARDPLRRHGRANYGDAVVNFRYSRTPGNFPVRTVHEGKTSAFHADVDYVLDSQTSSSQTAEIEVRLPTERIDVYGTRPGKQRIHRVEIGIQGHHGNYDSAPDHINTAVCTVTISGENLDRILVPQCDNLPRVANLNLPQVPPEDDKRGRYPEAVATVVGPIVVPVKSLEMATVYAESAVRQVLPQG